jgi:hypothetical protein
MINLNAPTRKIYYYNKIVNAKTVAATLARLQALEPAIRGHYNTYMTRANSNTLNLYAGSSYAVGVDFDMLENCYGAGAQVVKLKQKIRELQPLHLRHFCNFCMVGVADSFDHYLPNSVYPEFAVLSTNLIPACERCNKKKWTHFKDAVGERKIINFYFDALPAIGFLDCTVTNRPAGPVAKFKLRNQGLNANLYGLIKRHFETLEVLDRIHDHCPDEIDSIGKSLRQLVGVINRAQASTFLNQQAASERIDFGHNYCWALLKDQLAGDAVYLTSLGF